MAVAGKVPAFGDIGKATKELLYGDRDGVFIFEKQAKITTKTADGVEFGLTSKFKDSKVEQEVSASFKADKYALKASVNPAGKIVTTLTLTNPVPNLTLGISGALPDQSSGKLTLDYAVPNLTLKSSTTLTSNPVVNVAASTGYKGGVFGVSGVYDSKSASVSSWEAAAGYTSLDYQVAASLNNSDLAKLAYTHNLDRSASVGAEVSKKVTDSAESPTKFTVGYAKRLQGGGLAKARLDNAGIAALLYSAEVQPNTKVTHAVQFDVTNPNTPPKYGFALDLKA
jgi:voltage-dependent anion channel protein 2